MPQAACSTRLQAMSSPCGSVPTPFSLRAKRRPSVVAVAASGSGRCAGPDTSSGQHKLKDLSCRAVVALAELQVPEATTPEPPTPRATQVTQAASVSARKLQVDTVDVAIIGADISGIAAALAASKVPGARVMLYDTASEPPTERDGGVLLSVNGQRALKALDAGLYTRLTSDLSTSVQESLWFDLEGDLVRRNWLGQASLAASSSGATAVKGGRTTARRRAALEAARMARGNTEPDPAAPPLIVGLHELREAMMDALPQEVEVFGRHHVRAVENCPGGGATLQFALSPSAPPVRTVRAKVVVGADGPSSAVKRLKFDTAAQPATPEPTGRIVWRGRFTLRPRDPDCARLRNFITATRTWVDLRAPVGAERVAWLSPAGPSTFVWSASCPVALLAGRGMPEAAPAGVADWGQSSPYWRCLAMFEDFPEEFFASLRATAASAVTEAPAPRPLAPAASASAAAGLAAPWQWYSGATALVGDAVYGSVGATLAADDAANSALNLALEDAAVLGSCYAQHGLSQRALQEYGRLRSPRVSGLLALPLASQERVRLRDAHFLPQKQQPADGQVVGAAAAATIPAHTADPSTVHPAVPQAEAAVVMVAESTRDASDGTVQSPSDPPMVDLSRPSGGASRTTTGPAPSSAPGFSDPIGPSSPLFSRPSGARRIGPLPSAWLSIVSRAMAAGPSSQLSTAAAATAILKASLLTSSSPSSSPAVQPAQPAQPYTVESTPTVVWEGLLAAGASSANAAGPASSNSRSTAETAAEAQYCSVGTPSAVWHALLMPPPAAHATLVAQPYSPEESPSLVWMALLGAHVYATPPPHSSSSSAAAAAAIDAATLLPKPVPKHKSPRPQPARSAPAAPATAAVASPPIAAPSPTADLPQRAASAGRQRRPATDVSKSRGSTRRERKPAAAATVAAVPVTASSKPFKQQTRASKAAAAAGAAAKAAVNMTVSLSAAAALGGVISASGGHVPVDAMASALHVHGTVSQFWDELNNLSLASGSLSSIDMA